MMMRAKCGEDKGLGNTQQGVSTIKTHSRPLSTHALQHRIMHSHAVCTEHPL